MSDVKTWSNPEFKNVTLKNLFTGFNSVFSPPKADYEDCPECGSPVVDEQCTNKARHE